MSPENYYTVTAKNLVEANRITLLRNYFETTNKTKL